MADTSWNTRLTLLEKIRNRYDDSAWEDFVHYYQKYIYVILNSMGMDPDGSEELSQKIIIKLWEKLPDFEYQRGVGRFRSWLCTVVRNQVRNYFRDQKKAQVRLNDDTSTTVFEIPCDSAMEQLAEKEWNVYVAQLAWQNVSLKMPDLYKTVFQMHACGKSTQEIEDATDLPTNTVHVYLKRSRDKLKAEIKRLTNELL